MNLIEMDGFLRGKCIPGDMLVNESNAEYLVRKFQEMSAQRDALAAENAGLKAAALGEIEVINRGGQAYCVKDGMSVNPIYARGWNDYRAKSLSVETPETDAFLAEVRASAVEDFCKLIDVYAKVEPQNFNPEFADLYAKIVNRVFSGVMDNPGVYSLETMSDWLERESENSRAYADMSLNNHNQLRQGAAL
jgi:hypothetical protein